MAKKEETPVEQGEPAESAPETPVPESQAAPAAPAPEAPKKKGGAFKIILIVILVIVVIAGVAAGYGFYNGMRVKAYAKDAQRMIDGVKEWEKSLDNLDFEKDLAEIKTKIAQVKTDSEKNLTELNAKGAPGKAKNLEKDLKDYFTTAKEVAGEAGEMIDWAAEVQKVTKGLENLSSSSATSTEAMVADMEKQQAEMKKAQENLKKMTPPDSVKEYHDVLVSLLDDVIKLYDQTIAALKTGDINALMTLSTSSSTSSMIEKSQKLEGSDQKIEDSFDEDSKKLDSLESTIYTEIGELKNVTFSF